MAATPSTMRPLGSSIPPFDLPDFGVDGDAGAVRVSDDSPNARATVVMFICNHCPFVVHVREELARLARDFAPDGVRFLAINSNDISTHPDDAPDKMTEFARRSGFTLPYLYDESQRVARAFDAACTPDFFLFDAARTLVYRGQLDDSRPGNDLPVTGADLRTAIKATLAGTPVPDDQKPSIGCNIKWKQGEDPGGLVR